MRAVATLAAAAGTVLVVLQACGGGGAGSSSAPPPPPLPTGSNVAPLIVDAGPTQLGVNLPSVSVNNLRAGHDQLARPSTTSLVDTGSTGLRIVASALNARRSPVAGRDAPPSGDPLYECFTFADGYSWGSVRVADIQLADGQAANLSIQLHRRSGDSDRAHGLFGGSERQPAESDVAAEHRRGTGRQRHTGRQCFLAGLRQRLRDRRKSRRPRILLRLSGRALRGHHDPGGGATAKPGQQIRHQQQRRDASSCRPSPRWVKPRSVARSSWGSTASPTTNWAVRRYLSVDPLSGNFTAVFNGQTYTMGASIDSGSNGNFFTDSAWRPAPATVRRVVLPGHGGDAIGDQPGRRRQQRDLQRDRSVSPALTRSAMPIPVLLRTTTLPARCFSRFRDSTGGCRSFSAAVSRSPSKASATAAGTGPFVAYADFL